MPDQRPTHLLDGGDVAQQSEVLDRMARAEDHDRLRLDRPFSVLDRGPKAKLLALELHGEDDGRQPAAGQLGSR